MAISSRNRNIIVAAVIAIILVGLAAFLLGRGCDGDNTATSGTDKAATDTAARPSTLGTVTTAPAPVEPEPSPTPPAPPTPAPSEPATVPLEVIDRSVAPEVSNPGDTLTFTVLVRGTADRVVVSGERTTGGGAFDFEMAPAGTAGDVTTWTYSTEATTLTGVYRYYARAFAPDGTVVEMPGVSGYTFSIEP